MPAKHTSRAPYHLYSAYRDYDGALAELEIVRGTMPNSPRIFELTGFIARRRGAHDEGLRNLQRAVELDPRNFFTLQQLALSYELLRRFADEIATLDRALSIKPDDAETKAGRALAFFDWKADTRPLHRQIDEIRAKNPDAVESRLPMYGSFALWQSAMPPAADSTLRSLGDATFGDNATPAQRCLWPRPSCAHDKGRCKSALRVCGHSFRTGEDCAVAAGLWFISVYPRLD